ncbi:MAG: NAD(P)H-dependent oxidoreductase, partial [Ruminococcus sp.]|nr:NAD(P)H-dependent oxidoreductase [Ruminococcus sp.]
DLLIFTTPTYCMHMSAPLKSFFDLTFDMWMVHRPMESMFKKKAVIVSTSAGSSAKSAIKDVQDCLFYMGVPKIFKSGLAVQASNWYQVSDKKKAKIDKNTTRLAKKISSAKPAVSIKTSFMFRIMRMLHKKGWNSSPVETAIETAKKHNVNPAKDPGGVKSFEKYEINGYKAVKYSMQINLSDKVCCLTSVLLYVNNKIYSIGFADYNGKHLNEFNKCVETVSVK